MKNECFPSYLFGTDFCKSFLHFNNNKNQDSGDRLLKIKLIMSNFCIDESVLLWNGRLSFNKMYPKKRNGPDYRYLLYSNRIVTEKVFDFLRSWRKDIDYQKTSYVIHICSIESINSICSKQRNCVKRQSWSKSRPAALLGKVFVKATSATRLFSLLIIRTPPRNQKVQMQLIRQIIEYAINLGKRHSTSTWEYPKRVIMMVPICWLVPSETENKP